MDTGKNTSRRTFLKRSALSTTGSVLAAKTALTPSSASAQRNREKIRMGFIGVGNRGSQLLKAFMSFRDAEITALCDVYQPYLTRDRSQVNSRFIDELGGTVPQMGETFPNNVEKYTDFRKLLDNKDIDAVCIATPDHWHAVQTIMALEAGKDVYVEKPLTITIHEGRKMIEAAKRTNRVVQVGLNRRSSSIYQELAGMVKNGVIGKVTVSRAFHISNMYPMVLVPTRRRIHPRDSTGIYGSAHGHIDPTSIILPRINSAGGSHIHLRWVTGECIFSMLYAG